MVCTHKVFHHDGKTNAWAEYDAWAASVTLCLQATALGYQGDVNQLDKDFQSIEVTHRTRKPLAELVFDGAWESTQGI